MPKLAQNWSILPDSKIPISVIECIYATAYPRMAPDPPKYRSPILIARLTIPFYYATRLKALGYIDNRQLSSHKYGYVTTLHLETGRNRLGLCTTPRLHNPRPYPYVTAQRDLSQSMYLTYTLARGNTYYRYLSSSLRPLKTRKNIY